MIRKLLIVAGIALAYCSAALAQNQQPQGMQVQGVALNVSTLNSSATITTGNTFQTVLASMLGTATHRQSLTIENNNTNGDNCWLFIGPTATATKATSMLLIPGGSYTRYWPFVPSDNIAATCATTSDTLYVDNQ